jgi:membrane-bound lytic murein transglycosylase D
MKMRGLLVICVIIFLYGCNSTQTQPETDAPQIFTHFEPSYENQIELEPVQPKQLQQANTAPPVKAKKNNCKKAPRQS